VYSDVNSYIPDIDAIRIRTFSKEYCAPGLRIGYSLASNNISQKISDFISLTISCAPKFIQLAVAEYLESSESSDFNIKIKQILILRYKYYYKNKEFKIYMNQQQTTKEYSNYYNRALTKNKPELKNS
jgi:aspartate/methionine/tyrosine aminotransferase